MKPRQNTSSAAANWAAPSLTQTPMQANSRLAAIIQSDCMLRFGSVKKDAGPRPAHLGSSAAQMWSAITRR
jgi:hypothetical protein